MEQKRFRGSGMLGRYLYSIPESTLGRRKITPAEVDAEVRSGYESLTHGLLSIQTPRNERGEYPASRPEMQEFTRQQLYQVVRRRVTNPDELDGPLRKLTDHGFVRGVTQRNEGAGRKPSPRYEVNPQIITDDR